MNSFLRVTTNNVIVLFAFTPLEASFKTLLLNKFQMKYQCRDCVYAYDPAKGDPSKGIEPGTKFQNLPENWQCPICGANKGRFKSI